jgi:hypothetical protein
VVRNADADDPKSDPLKKLEKDIQLVRIYLFSRARLGDLLLRLLVGGFVARRMEKRRCYYCCYVKFISIDAIFW